MFKTKEELQREINEIESKLSYHEREVSICKTDLKILNEELALLNQENKNELKTLKYRVVDARNNEILYQSNEKQHCINFMDELYEENSTDYIYSVLKEN